MYRSPLLHQESWQLVDFFIYREGTGRKELKVGRISSWRDLEEVTTEVTTEWGWTASIGKKCITKKQKEQLRVI